MGRKLADMLVWVPHGTVIPYGPVANDQHAEKGSRRTGIHGFRGSFLPFERYTLISALPPTVVVEWLAKNTGPRRWWTQKGPRLFQGAVNKAEFEVRPTIWYANAWLPVITGTVRDASGGGARVTVSVAPILSGAIFGGIWMMLATAGGVAILVGGSTSGLIMPALGYLIITGAFKWEARRVRKTLVRCLCSERQS